MDRKKKRLTIQESNAISSCAGVSSNQPLSRTLCYTRQADRAMHRCPSSRYSSFFGSAHGHEWFAAEKQIAGDSAEHDSDERTAVEEMCMTSYQLLGAHNRSDFETNEDEGDENDEDKAADYYCCCSS